MTRAVLPTAGRRPRLLFDAVPERRLAAHEWSLDAESGQLATFARATASTATDRDGRTIQVPPQSPRFTWGTLDFDDEAVGVGLALSGDTLTYPFTPSVPLTLYLRFARGSGSVAGVICVIGGTSGARLVISEDPATGYSALYHNGVTSVTSTVACPLFRDERVELRCVLDGDLTLSLSLNGSFEEYGATSAAIAQATAWGTPTLSLGQHVGGTLPTAHTFVRCAVALGDVAIDAFRPGGRTRYSGAFLTSAVIQLVSPGVYSLGFTGVADKEFVDVGGMGAFTLVAAGTSPAADRIAFQRIAGRNVVGSA